MMDSNTIRDPWETEAMYHRRLKARSTIQFSRLVTYRTDAVLVRSYKPCCAGTVTASKGKIGGKPSRRSLQRLTFLLNNCDTPMTSMLTITMRDQVCWRNSVSFHRKTIRLACQRLRDTDCSQYCWVREFQKGGRVHWHIFTDHQIDGKGREVDRDRSKAWSRWLVQRYKKSGWCNEESARLMMADSYDGFVGCCRLEKLMSPDAGGRYAGKEGAKRYQKDAPPRWLDGGAWWRASRNVICTPTGEKKIHGRYLQKTTVEIDGDEREVPHRIQFGKGTG